MKLAKTLTVSLLIISFLMGTVWAADTPAQSQTTCPVMGGKINKDIYADYEGKRVYFCCEACVGPFKQDPAKYVKKLEDQGVVLERVPAGEDKHDQEQTPSSDKAAD